MKKDRTLAAGSRKNEIGVPARVDGDAESLRAKQSKALGIVGWARSSSGSVGGWGVLVGWLANEAAGPEET